MKADVRGPDYNYMLSEQAQRSEDQGMANAIFGLTDKILISDDLLAEGINEYRSFSERFLKLYANRTITLAQVVRDVSSLAQSLDPAAELHGRVKNLDSTWRKMCGNRIVSDQVLDIIGVRVIMPRTRDCYRLVERIGDLFEVTKSADYIERPKPNGYRSLHTTIIDPSGHTVEFQIRTPWMHALAEWGTAAHWRYKQQCTFTEIQPAANRSPEGTRMDFFRNRTILARSTENSSQ